MGLFSLIIALLLEQAKPLQKENVVYQAVRKAAAALEHNLNAGEVQHGAVAWFLLVIPLTVVSALIFVLLFRAHPFLGLGWNVAVLYVTLGFRQFSHYYTDIQEALATNDLALARRLLTDWKWQTDEHFSAAELDVEQIARIAIEEALIASHRHVFGVFFWFVVLLGPSGAVLYRVSEYLARRWNRTRLSAGPADAELFGHFAAQAFYCIDWLPVRMTAIGFAIVGNFEDAIFVWRNYAAQWRSDHRSQAIILASGAGALGVRLGDAHHFTASEGSDGVAEPMPGLVASPSAMRSGIGLVWRSMLLWLLLLLLLSVAGLFS